MVLYNKFDARLSCGCSGLLHYFIVYMNSFATLPSYSFFFVFLQKHTERLPYTYIILSQSCTHDQHRLYDKHTMQHCHALIVIQWLSSRHTFTILVTIPNSPSHCSSHALMIIYSVPHRHAYSHYHKRPFNSDCRHTFIIILPFEYPQCAVTITISLYACQLWISCILDSHTSLSCIPCLYSHHHAYCHKTYGHTGITIIPSSYPHHHTQSLFLKSVLTNLAEIARLSLLIN